MADKFYPNGDDNNCQFAQTVSVSYDNLPIPTISPHGLNYDVSSIRGEKGDFITRSNFRSIGEIIYPNARRFLNSASSVDVPPNSDVLFGYYVVNYSGHSINVSNGNLFLSRFDPNLGDLTKLGAKGTYIEQSFLYKGEIEVRKGKAIGLSSWGNWPISDIYNPPKGVEIYRFKTIQPISIENQNITYKYLDSGKLEVSFSVVLKNNSSYLLNNIRYSHNGFSKILNLNPGASENIFYSLIEEQDRKKLSYGFAEIYDPNYHKECVGVGSNTASSTNPETRMIITNRSDSPAPISWTAGQVDFAAVPGGDFICVNLIPYSIYSDNFNLNLSSDLNLTYKVSDSDEKLVDSTTSNPGENLRYTINLHNDGAVAENISVILNYDNRYLKYLSSCEALINQGEKTLTFSLDALSHAENWSCEVIFEISNELAPGIYEIKSTANYSESGGALIESNSLISKITSTASIEANISGEQNLNCDQDFTTSIKLNNTGNTIARNAVIYFQCAECDQNSMQVSSEKILLESSNDIPIGVYEVLIKGKYSRNIPETSAVQQCIEINFQSEISRKCLDIQINCPKQLNLPTPTPTAEPATYISTTPFFSDSESPNTNEKSYIPVSSEKSSMVSLANTGENILLVILISFVVIVVPNLFLWYDRKHK